MTYSHPCPQEAKAEDLRELKASLGWKDPKAKRERVNSDNFPPREAVMEASF